MPATDTRSRPVALVTGASGGIGLELARLLAAGGHDLVLVARTAANLDEAAAQLARAHGVRALAVRADLFDPAAPDAVARRLGELRVEVDVLVNNAGVGVGGRFLETDWRAEADMIQLNVTALTRLTKLLLPGMVRRGRGRVLNVASTAAFQPGPLMAVYHATKAYVLSFSYALAEEVRGTGVTVTVLAPGPTRTGRGEGAGVARSRLFETPLVMTSRAVARAGYTAMMRGRRLVVPGLLNAAMAHAAELAPRRLTARIAEALQAGSGRRRPTR
jgi:uncharacterized protein